MSAYIRPLSLADKEQCGIVESAAFPPAEAATPVKIEYRLTVCPEICFGLFAPKDTKVATPLPDNTPVYSENTPKDGEELIAHVIATRATAKTVRDQDMEVPKDWRKDPTAKTEVGHLQGGRTITLHSLAVSPKYQRSGIGKTLMNAYIEHIRKTGTTDRISILTYGRLLPYYQKLGFTLYGKSESTYAGVAWYDLAYEF
ncbi:acyl-CoA N-acyltransferase [Aaosphaeria arxii CBS 175.79]|uniref:Acyl-CoA N-acyltransferase n=1 Tax=Aaosphaeria arxii CBS 175.79 TaxID=1450172 RepID=A0A6A5Y3Q5_9PLEO|nr:acyl-CoA N-acyltransferase [Aaosphaeria arxii CBS 175.79]KAF2020108.1 acyl-CoA N-acyltransferase [Aaosphaeria arxii CBS 175.79]